MVRRLGEWGPNVLTAAEETIVNRTMNPRASEERAKESYCYERCKIEAEGRLTTEPVCASIDVDPYRNRSPSMTYEPKSTLVVTQLG